MAGLPVHHPGARGGNGRDLCFIRAHSSTFYGLGYADSPAVGGKKRKTKRVPGKNAIKKHKAGVLALLTPACAAVPLTPA